MNKKLITLAVAGAFAAPAAALAQASNVQIFGTMYMEYAYAKQGASANANGVPAGDQPNLDILQSPGSEIGVKGEEALGGGTSAWFQCTSTADIRGGTAGGGGSTAGFCSRNSAIGVKGSFGNVYFGNWDMAMKRTAGAARITSDTGIWGVGRMLYGDSSTFGGNSTPTSFSRRQNSSVFYDTPNFSGFQGYFGYSTTTGSTGQLTTAASGSKPRMWSLAGTYSNGPLYATLAYESHANFGTFSGAAAAPNTPAAYSSTDTGWHAGVAYQFGPAKVGLLYVQRKYDMSADGATSSKVTAWNLAGEWAIQGPHALRGGYTKSNNVSGSAGVATQPGVNQGAGPVVGTAGGGFVANCQSTGVVNTSGTCTGTGGSIWQIQYVYSASKRTEFTVGYVALSNDANARYSLGGLAAAQVAPGQNQSAFAVSMKNTF